MKSLCFSFCFLFFAFTGSAQSWDVLKTWPNETLVKAKATANNRFMTSTENEVLFLLNLARSDGRLFSETILKRFADSTDYETNKYYRSLQRELASISNLPLLNGDSLLVAIASAHARHMGQTGRTGHDRFDERYKPALKPGWQVAENCFYGPGIPLIIVAELLIDEGVDDLGHRRNILDPVLTRIGIGIAPHKEYESNCVMSFSGQQAGD